MPSTLQKAQAPSALEVSELYFRYPGMKKHKWLLKNINLAIQAGAWTTILGPNGSGKSTIAKIIAKILVSQKGDITFDGQNIKTFKGKSLGKKVAYIPQIIATPEDTSVYDFISFGRHPHQKGFSTFLSKKDKAIIKKAMQETDTWAWKDKMMSELSGGERQKTLIAMIIAQDAEIILLDEPTTYLDIRNQYELLEMLHYEHTLGKTIITILHDINQSVQYSDYIYLIKEGAVFKGGTPMEVINKSNLEEVYRIKAALYQDKARKYLYDVQLTNFHYKAKRDRFHEHDHEHEVKAEVMTKK